MSEEKVLMMADCRHIQLTRNEKAVLRMMAEDKNRLTIAAELGCHESTVRLYVRDMEKQFGVKTVAGLIYKATKAEII